MKNMVSQIKDERTISVHNEHEFLLKMEKAGLTNKLAQKVIDSRDNKLATRVVRFIQSGGFKPTTSQKLARDIMGKNFFGVEEAFKYFKVSLTKTQLIAFSKVPFSKEILSRCKDTHILVATLLSILNIRNKVERKLFFCHRDAWYNNQSFVKTPGSIEWKLVRKNPVEKSFSKTWKEQNTLLNENEEIPTAQVMVYTIIGHYLASGERLFEDIYIRTSDTGLDNKHVIVGGFDCGGLHVSSRLDDNIDYTLGLSSIWKSK